MVHGRALSCVDTADLAYEEEIGFGVGIGFVRQPVGVDGLVLQFIW